MTLADLVYSRLTPFYDVMFGAMLQEGRRRAMAYLRPDPGESVLEIGVGTGADLHEYPAPCRVTAIDLSMAMLEHARAPGRRLDDGAGGVRANGCDEARVPRCDRSMRSMRRTSSTWCPIPRPSAAKSPASAGPDGRVVLLNHFDGVPETTNLTNHVAGRIANLFSVNWDLHLDDFLTQAGLEAITVESVNRPRLSSIVLCRVARTVATGCPDGVAGR